MGYQGQIAAEARKYIELMPRKRTEIIELAELALEEISSGGSPDREIELMVSELDELLDQEAKTS